MNVQLQNSFFVYLVLFGGFPPLLLVYHILHDLSIDGMDKKSLADSCISYANLWDTILTFSSATHKKTAPLSACTQTCGAVFSNCLGQYRTKIVRQMRRQIFRQMKQKAE